MGAHHPSLHSNNSENFPRDPGRRRWRGADSNARSGGKVAIILINFSGDRAFALTSKLTPMFDVLIVVGGLAVWLFGLFDCARTDQDRVRNLPKWAWLLIIIIFGSLGAIAWLLIGRAKSITLPRSRPGRMIPPDDNPDFLKQL